MSKKMIIFGGVAMVVIGIVTYLVFIQSQQKEKRPEVTGGNIAVSTVASSVATSSPVLQAESFSTPTPAELAGLEKHSFASPGEEYSFDVYWIQDKNQCFFQLKNAKGDVYDVQPLVKFDTIFCSFESGNNSSFEGWTDKNTFLLSKDFKEVFVVRLPDLSIKKYQPNGTNLIFRAVDPSLDYWLFQQGTQGSYQLFGTNSSEIKEIDNSYDRPVLFDQTNNGFVFIGRSYKDSTVSVHIDFLSLKDFSLKHALITSFVPIEGMDCPTSEKLLSVPGEIILTQGCLQVGNEYLGSDRNIHIPLMQ